MNELADHELRARFGQLRTADASDTPDFRELVDRADRTGADTDRHEPRRLPRVAVPVALAAAIVLAVGVTRVARRRAPVQAPLSTWTSPTASLLRTPGIGLFKPSSIHTSVLDPATSTSFLLKGTKR